MTEGAERRANQSGNLLLLSTASYRLCANSPGDAGKSADRPGSCFCVLLLGKQEISVNTIAQPGICNLSALPLFIRAVSGETLAGRFSK